MTQRSTLLRSLGPGMGIILLLLCLGASGASGQEAAIASRELIERLVRLEEGQKALSQRLEEGQKALSQRLEEGQKALSQRLEDMMMLMNQRFTAVDQRFTAVDQRFTAVDERISELREFLIWGFGVMFAGMFTLIGFVLWDRRTALSPAVRRLEELDDREHRLEAALREYARGTSGLADALRKYGLL